MFGDNAHFEGSFGRRETITSEKEAGLTEEMHNKQGRGGET